jgi:predicted HAD superfamily Cof-like phosphohydrolase
MKEQLEKVKTFQKKFNSTFNENPSFISGNEYHLRYKLLSEENQEYFDACVKGDLVEILDAVTDQLFIVLGTAISHGLQDKLKDAFNEVYNSNMSKLDKNGNAIINGKNGVLDKTKPIGKILKSNEYFEPNLKQFINE